MINLILFLTLAPTHEFPYLDALPLDYPNRLVVYGHFHGLVPNREWCCVDYPQDREASRLFLLDRLLQGGSSDQVWYLLGRLQGRHPMWQTWRTSEGGFTTGWYDEAALRVPEQIGAPGAR